MKDIEIISTIGLFIIVSSFALLTGEEYPKDVGNTGVVVVQQDTLYPKSIKSHPKEVTVTWDTIPLSKEKDSSCCPHRDTTIYTMSSPSVNIRKAMRRDSLMGGITHRDMTSLGWVHDVSMQSHERVRIYTHSGRTWSCMVVGNKSFMIGRMNMSHYTEDCPWPYTSFNGNLKDKAELMRVMEQIGILNR